MELTTLINFIISSLSSADSHIMFVFISSICIYKNSYNTYQNHSEWFSNDIGSFKLTASVMRQSYTYLLLSINFGEALIKPTE